MADKDKPYRYFDIEEEFNSNEVKDLIHFILQKIMSKNQ